MSRLTASVTDVSRNFSDYINRATYTGDTFVLVRGGKPVAELRGCPRFRKMADLPEIMASLPSLSEKDAADFKDDLRQARESIAAEEVSPWDV